MITTKIDLAEFRRRQADRLITINQHPTEPLLIHNYTPHCQYSRAWDDVTIQARGLITDLDGNVVARPFPKFFNWEEHASNPALPSINWNQGFCATVKMDGSLAILHWADGRYRIATRGSFESPQAKEGEAIFYEREYDRYLYSQNLTYLFEIVSPITKVVVDYSGQRDLFLLDVIDVKGQASFDYQIIEWIAGQIGCPVVPRVHFDDLGASTLAQYQSTNVPNSEGVVIRFDDGMRVKAKLEEYKRLHRLVTGVNSKVIWEALRDGREEELLERVPDEFGTWVRETIDKIMKDFQDIALAAISVRDKVQRELGNAPRKDYALRYIQEGKLAPVLFKLFDGRDPADIVWKLVKTETAVPFRTDPEEE